MANWLYVEKTPYATPAAAQYAQWADELGVSSTATLQPMDGDDAVWGFTLASDCLVAGANQAEFSSEGMVGWSVPPKAYPAIVTFDRMYYVGNTQPDMLWGFRFNADCKSVGVKLQKASGVTILGGTIAFLVGSTQTLDFAVRFSSVLSEPPQVVVTVGAGAYSAEIGALLRPATVNFAKASVLPGETVLLTHRHDEPNAVFQPALGGSVSMGAQGQQPGPIPSRFQPVTHGWKNIHQSGNGTISGTVKVGLLPAARKVRLFNKRTGMLVGETWSSASGHYEFNNIDATQDYFTVAHDHTQEYNAAVADMLRAGVPT